MLKKIVWDTNKQYAVLGLGKFGVELAKSLASFGCEVLAVDQKEELTNALIGIATHTVTADVSDEGVLRSLDIDSYDAVIIAIGENIQASIVCALCCKELGAKYIVAKAKNDKHAKILQKIGVDKIVVPEADSAQRTATMLFNPNVCDIIEMEEGYTISQINLPRNWLDKDIVSLNIRGTYNINVLFVVGREGVYVPSTDSKFAEGDKVVIGGLTEAIDKFIMKVTK
ncbi:MAG: TrkA family potassium uptake protein [Clostridia bacterium]